MRKTIGIRVEVNWQYLKLTVFFFVKILRKRSDVTLGSCWLTFWNLVTVLSILNLRVKNKNRLIVLQWDYGSFQNLKIPFLGIYTSRLFTYTTFLEVNFVVPVTTIFSVLNVQDELYERSIYKNFRRLVNVRSLSRLGQRKRSILKSVNNRRNKVKTDTKC